jgi:hypothetical protein
LILSLLEQAVEFQQRRWPDNHGSPLDAAWVEKQRPEAHQETIQCLEIGGASPGAIDDQELLSDQQAVSDDGLCAAGSQEFG